MTASRGDDEKLRLNRTYPWPEWRREQRKQIAASAREIAAFVSQQAIRPSEQAPRLVEIAHSLREAMAVESAVANGNWVAEPPRLRIRHALAVAVSDLARRDPDMARIADLRLFALLTIAEIAELLQLRRAEIDRSWRGCRRWLFAAARLQLRNTGRHDA